MAICADIPQVPAAGVNVYTVWPGFVVLIEEGLQVPLTPSFDVCGRAGGISFWQIELGMVGKVGEMLITIVMFKKAGVEQLAAEEGVNW